MQSTSDSIFQHLNKIFHDLLLSLRTIESILDDSRKSDVNFFRKSSTAMLNKTLDIYIFIPVDSK